VLRCQECGAETETGEGWRAYLTIDDETAVYCPACARREFSTPKEDPRHPPTFGAVSHGQAFSRPPAPEDDTQGARRARLGELGDIARRFGHAPNRSRFHSRETL